MRLFVFADDFAGKLHVALRVAFRARAAGFGGLVVAINKENFEADSMKFGGHSASGAGALFIAAPRQRAAV